MRTRKTLSLSSTTTRLDNRASSSQYLVTTVEGALVDLLTFGLVHPKAIYRESPLSSMDPTHAMHLAIQCLCQELIPETIGLTNAFEFMDWDLDRLIIFLLFTCMFSNNHAAFL